MFASLRSINYFVSDLVFIQSTTQHTHFVKTVLYNIEAKI